MKILRTDGTIERRAPIYDHASLQKEVGGYIEFFSFADGSALCVNDEGKLRALPRNADATALTAQKGRPEVIVGDAVYFTSAEMLVLNADSDDA